MDLSGSVGMVLSGVIVLRDASRVSSPIRMGCLTPRWATMAGVVHLWSRGPAALLLVPLAHAHHLMPLAPVLPECPSRNDPR